jgi:hypothetical protein
MQTFLELRQSGSCSEARLPPTRILLADRAHLGHCLGSVRGKHPSKAYPF